MKIFISSSTCENSWIICMSESTNWSMSPEGEFFTNDLLTYGKSSPFFYLNEKDKSRISWKSRDLWGIMAIGEILNWSGGLTFILSHKNTLHLPFFYFATTSFASIFIAICCNADTCGPQSIASYIWFKVQVCPVIVGQTLVANYSNFPAEGWCSDKSPEHIDPL